MKLVYSYLFCLIAFSSLGQGVNYQALYNKESNEYKAHELIYGERRGDKSDFQGTKESQALCDSAIALYPKFADAYYTKAIPYLKRGEFHTWKTLIDKAVKYDQYNYYLGYRGGARFMFLRDYNGAINDIETLKEITDSDIGTIYNGEYHLEVIRALSYKGILNTEKGIDILEKHIQEYGYVGLYDYFHLGVMYFETNDFDKAESCFIKQIERNDQLADTYYYLGLIEKGKQNNTSSHEYMLKAYNYYIQGRNLRGLDSYMDYPDKVYFDQIKEALSLK